MKPTEKALSAKPEDGIDDNEHAPSEGNRDDVQMGIGALEDGSQRLGDNEEAKKERSGSLSIHIPPIGTDDPTAGAQGLNGGGATGIDMHSPAGLGSPNQTDAQADLQISPRKSSRGGRPAVDYAAVARGRGGVDGRSDGDDVQRHEMTPS